MLRGDPDGAEAGRERGLWPKFMEMKEKSIFLKYENVPEFFRDVLI
jgi:hypothetical protein